MTKVVNVPKRGEYVYCKVKVDSNVQKWAQQFGQKSIDLKFHMLKLKVIENERNEESKGDGDKQ